MSIKTGIAVAILGGFTLGFIGGIRFVEFQKQPYYKTDLSRKEMIEGLKKAVKFGSGYAMIIPGDTTVMPYLIKGQ